MAFGPYNEAPDGMASTHNNGADDDDDDEETIYPKDGYNVVARKSTLYDSLPWGVDFYESLVSVAPFGGPIAVLPNDSSTITVYTSAGRPMRSFPVPKVRVKKAPIQVAGAVSFQHASLVEDVPEEIVVIGWNLEESLIALSLSGNVYAFSLSSPELHERPELAYGGAPVCIAGCRWGNPDEEISPEEDPFSLCYALVGPSGIVVQDEQFRIKGVLYEERKEPTRFEVELYDYIDQDVVAMDVIPRETNYEREHTIIVAPGKGDTKVKGSLLLVNASDGVVTDLNLNIRSGVSNIKRDHNGNFVALSTRDGRLLLANCNLDRILFSFNLRFAGLRPSSILWVGPDVVSLQFSRGDVDEYRYDDFSLLVCVNANTHAAVRRDREREKALTAKKGGPSQPQHRTRSRSGMDSGAFGRTHSNTSTVFGVGHQDGGGVGQMVVGVDAALDCLSDDRSDLFHVINWGTEANGGLCRVVQEVDGMRVVTEEGCFLVEQLPLATVRTLYSRTQSLPAKLMSAFKRYTSHGDVVPLFKLKSQLAKADESSGAMGRVLDDLLSVAVHQLDVTVQRQVLQVVSFVVPLVRGYDSDRYVDVVKRLRVLNAVRHISCGMPLTHRQYEELAGAKNLRSIVGPEAQGLVDRLVNRQEFQLALEIATQMNIRTQKLFVQWSCAKVLRASGSDAALKRELVAVLANCPGASFIDAALTAFDVNRKDLAVSLLQEDPRPSNQVMLFLQMGQDKIALQRACESGDADLVLMALIKLLREGSYEEVITGCGEVAECVPVVEELGWVNREYEVLVGEHYRRLGWACWKGYRILKQRLLNHTFFGDEAPQVLDDHQQVVVRSDQPDLAEEGFDEVEDLRRDDADSGAARAQPSQAPMAAVAVGAAFAGPDGTPCAFLEGLPGPRNVEGVEYLADADFRDILESLESTVNSFSAPGSLQSACKEDCAWLKKHAQLTQTQRQLCDLAGTTRFLNASVHRTIQYCVEEGLEEDAQRLKQQFHIKESVFWHLKLRAYVESERWSDLDAWAGGGADGQKSKIKSPIGFEPFVAALCDAGRYDQMSHFVRKLNGLVKRVEWFTQIDRFDWAADEAYKEDDVDMLRQILRFAKDDRTASYIQSYIDDLA